MFINDRTKPTAPRRRALALAGVATLVFSLVFSIAPALAAPGGNSGNGANGGNGGNGGGNAGTVKIHDATTNLEAGETGNEPRVCSFWIGFYTSDAAETGTWRVVSWPPTGDGTVVASGTYDTTGDGADTTTVLSLAEGHYRLEWESITDTTSKHKTFWVACEPVEEPADPSDEADPSGEASPSEEAAPTDESQPTDEASPSEEESQPTDEASPSEEESQPTDEAAPADEEESRPPDEAAPADEEESRPPDESSLSEEAAPTDDEEAAPTDDEEAAPTEPAQEPEGEVKAGNPYVESGTGGQEAPAQGGAPVLPDTSTSTQKSGVLATIGILLILAAHMGTRRERTLPSA